VARLHSFFSNRVLPNVPAPSLFGYSRNTMHESSRGQMPSIIWTEYLQYRAEAIDDPFRPFVQQQQMASVFGAVGSSTSCGIGVQTVRRIQMLWLSKFRSGIGVALILNRRISTTAKRHSKDRTGARNLAPLRLQIKRILPQLACRDKLLVFQRDLWIYFYGSPYGNVAGQ
jgi:hypothetical protein